MGQVQDTKTGSVEGHHGMSGTPVAAGLNARCERCRRGRMRYVTSRGHAACHQRLVPRYRPVTCYSDLCMRGCPDNRRSIVHD